MKGEDFLNYAFADFVSPLSRKQLIFRDNSFVAEDGSERYELRHGIPIFLSPNEQPYWDRELIEAILWQYPETVTEMKTEMRLRRKKYGLAYDPNLLYCEYIEKTLGDKRGIIEALEQYAAADTSRWKVENGSFYADELQLENNFKKYSKWLNGRKRVKNVQKSLNGKGWAKHYPYYVSETFKNSPKKILELSTGAGGGTSAICISKPSDCTVYTMDIDWICHGNTVGIGKYLKCRGTLIPVTANFWHMPFADGFFDTVCTHYGLDESRENDKTFAETARVLKSGGKFVVTARKNAFMRQGRILEHFGFTEDETVELMKKCRMYADTEAMISECEKVGFCFENHREFQISEKHTAVVTTFIKE